MSNPRTCVDYHVGTDSVVVPSPPVNEPPGLEQRVGDLYVQRPMRTQNPLIRSQTDAQGRISARKYLSTGVPRNTPDAA